MILWIVLFLAVLLLQLVACILIPALLRKSLLLVSRCRLSDGLLLYCPHTKQTDSSSDYKLDEGRSTPNTYNLQYDGEIFVGLYDHCPTASQTESYPEGTSVAMAVTDRGVTGTGAIIWIRGTVISVPIPVSGAQLPASASDAPPYVIRLIDGSIMALKPGGLLSLI